MARDLARTAAKLNAALDAELWASHMLGTFWRARYELPFGEAVGIDPAVEFGEPLLRQFARIDDPGAAIATLAIAELADGELGLQAKEMLDSQNMWRRLPRWAGDVGESEIVGAAVIRDVVFDDAQTVLLESRHADGQTLAVGVLIDHNLSRMAKDVLLAESIEQVEESMGAYRDQAGEELILERVEPGVAAGLISEAIRVTDMTWDPLVADDYWGGRAIALLRSDQTTGLVRPEEPEEMPTAEREALRGEFLAAPEGAGIDPESDEAWVALLAIDFAAGYLGDDPLRWSPTVVELFMLDWLPRKVITTPEMLEVMPGALDAWVRFAARKRGVADRFSAQTREAIVAFSAEAVEAAGDPEVAGLSKQFLMAAVEAGVDIEDVDALRGFTAGWNARSMLDVEDVGSVSGHAAPNQPDPMSDQILQVKVSLKGVSKPPVWRRLQLPASTRLDDLHQIIQIAFGWDDQHLHMFEAGGEYFGHVDPELDPDCADERHYTLAQLAAASDRLRYTYDFGDEWCHEIRLEKLLEPEAGVAYPHLVTGKGACPPEDCGGAWGYENLKYVVADPTAEQHEELREWMGLAEGEAFDPTAFDPDAISAGLAGWRRALA
jgi:hypothetical protein